MFKRTLLFAAVFAFATPVLSAPAPSRDKTTTTKTIAKTTIVTEEPGGTKPVVARKAGNPTRNVTNPVSKATELTNPFYTPAQGKFSALAFIETWRYQIKNTEDYNVRVYLNSIGTEFSYGILDSLSFDVGLSNTWMRWSVPSTFLRTSDSNIDWYAGMTYAPSLGNFKTQFKGMYGQKETLAHYNNGAYKYIRAVAKLGYDFDGLVTPYVAGSWELPVAASRGITGIPPFNLENSKDKPAYNARVGVYKFWNDKVSTDFGLSVDHLKDADETYTALDGEVAYFFTPNFAVSIYALYGFKGHAEGNADIFNKKAGLRLRAQF